MTAQYVWGLDYVNDLVERDDSLPTGGTGSLGSTDSGLAQRIYAITDANCDVTAIASATGGVLERFQYDAYGTQTVLTPSYTSTSDSYLWSVGFQGGFVDQITGLIHFGARDYNAATGRWMEDDPIGSAGSGTNLYQFCGDNPAARIDPSGDDFIALADRSLKGFWGHVSPFYHYSLELWQTKCDEDRPADEQTIEHFKDWNDGAKKLASVQLLNDSWHQDKSGGQETNVSVIYYDNDTAVTFVAVDYGDPSAVKKRWDKLIEAAKAYKYAEQSGSDVAKNWPNSHYETSQNGNNSNTFALTMLKTVDLPAILLTGWHPGADSPHNIDYVPDGVNTPPHP